MKGYPLDWPRLSGRLWYSLPSYWEVADTDESIEIIPAKTPRGLMVYFAVLGLIVVAGTQLVLSRLPAFTDKGWATVLSIGVALSMMLLCVFLRVTCAREQARGPILVISFAKKEICLPRAGKAWPFDSIVRWEIVYGAWVRGSGKYAKPHLFPDVISELQMVVENDNGEKNAWPIIGAGGRPGSWRYRPNLLTVADKIAKRTELPLLVTREERLKKVPAEKNGGNSAE
jgi:hypothetical protein